MIKSFISFFVISFLIFPAAQAETLTETLNKTKEAAGNGLSLVESLPGAEEVGAIVSMIKSATDAYRTISAQITSAISYSQEIIQLLKESLEKIKSDGLKIKEYVENKINFIIEKYE